MVGRELRDLRQLWSTSGGFAEYVAAVRADTLEETPRPDGWVPSTTWWLLDGDEYLGRIAVRHRLTKPLRVLEDEGRGKLRYWVATFDRTRVA
ncbi:MAG: hypothetical protein ABI352_03415 [Candidatus Dormibacter sp.]